MKKIILIVALLFIMISFSFSAQKAPIQKNENLNVSNSNLYFSFSPPSDYVFQNLMQKYSNGTSSSGLVAAGKTLTALGISFLILGPALIGLSFLFVWLTYYSILGTTNFIIVNWALAWQGMFMIAGFYPLAAVACFLLIMGIILSIFSLMVIPGIILWAVGASKSRSAKRITPLKENLGLAIRL